MTNSAKKPLVLALAAVLALGATAVSHAQQPATPPPSGTSETGLPANGTQGGTKQQPRGTVETTGTTGAIAPGPSATDKEKRALERSDRATKGICQGC